MDGHAVRERWDHLTICSLAPDHDRVQDVPVAHDLSGQAARPPGARSQQKITALVAPLLVAVVVVVVVGIASGILVPGPAASHPASASLGAVAPTGPAASPQGSEPATSADTSSPPPSAPQATGASIVPGSVNRTSINLVATYDADVRLGYGDRSLRVDVTVSVTNRSGAGVDRVELNTIAGPLGNLRLRLARVDGVDVAAKLNEQTIVVPLGGVLPDGATTVLRVRFRATLRSTLGGSSWMFTRTGGILQANRWLPWVGLHRPFDRPNHGDPFFTALSPSIRVRITSDRRLVIAAPGRRVAVDGLTQTFEAENVRDFPIVASPWFSIRERHVGGWTLRAFVRDGFPTGKVLDWSADGLRRMSGLAGPYPYSTFTIAQTAGGYALEGPGMIWIPTGLTGSRLRWNVYHETAHQWFYGLVGSDHALDPFADEGVATHLGQVAAGIWRDTGCPKRRLDLSIYRYSEACYFGQIYVHGADLLQRVRRAMDTGEYWRAVRAYVAANRFAIGSTREFLDTLQAHTTRDLQPILAPWFPSLY
jgi:hypothetical protein